jgi:hypothetical protein
MLGLFASLMSRWRRWSQTWRRAQFFQSGLGLAFLHRLVLAPHLVCVEVGACGIRSVYLLLNLTGLDRFVAASYGVQQQVNRQVEQAIVAYRHAETAPPEPPLTGRRTLSLWATERPRLACAPYRPALSTSQPYRARMAHSL